MFRIYKRSIQIGSTEPLQSLEHQDHHVADSGQSTLLKWLTVPAMIAGAVAGTLVFSVFFLVLLIPMAIFGFRFWRMMQKAKQKADDQTINAEYTVIHPERDQD